MSQKKADIFARIAQQGMDFAGKDLYIPQPPEKPEKYLDLTDSAQHQMQYPKEMGTKEELADALAAMRQTFAPFMEDHAPRLSEHRSRQYLRSFSYRLETEQDRRDFQSVLNGAGEWETVRIPHFWGPLGYVRAFYRTGFQLSEEEIARGCVYVCFKAVDYKAHVFVNGCYLGSHEGFFAPFEFDFTACARVGENQIVVIVENDFVTGGVGDKIYAATGVGYDDPDVGWHHCPPGFGIYQDCYIESRPKVFLRDIFVRPLVDRQSADAQFEVYNTENTKRKLTFAISVYGQNFRQTVFENEAFAPTSTIACGRGDTLTVASRIANGEYDASFHLPTCFRINTFHYAFDLPEMRLWELDTPYLYQIQIRVLDEEGQELDSMARHFGMRSFTQDAIGEAGAPKGMFYLNGRPIRLRGSNTMGNEQQCVFKKDFDQLRDDILLAKLCNMNFLRITQRPVETEVYDYCDMLGLMTQCDLPLFGALRRNQFYEGIRQAGEMERLVRSHPCNILTTYINEPFPNANNQEQLSLTRAELEEFFKACDIAVHQQNPDRVIKPVDGDYDPPEPGLPDNHCYFMWYNGHGIDMGRLLHGYWMPVKPGWYYGCGEFGTEGLDPVEVMRKYYPQNWLPHTPEEEGTWSPNSIVNSQTGKFYYMFYEKPNTLADWCRESQKYQAFATKLMAEAFRRDSRMVTFAIHLFIDAFPSGWMKTIMDVDRVPKPAYFAYRDALTPLMVSLRTDCFKYFSGDEVRLEAWVCNDLIDVPEGAVLQYQIEDEHRSVVFSGRQPAEIPCNSSAFQGYIRFVAPDTADRTLYIAHAAILNTDGTVLHHNTLSFEVLAKTERVLHPVCALGDTAQALARELGAPLAPALSPQTTLLISDYEVYQARKEEIDTAVQAGARAVFLALPAGDYAIADTCVSVKMCSMMPVHFVARNTGHAMVLGFRSDDFRYWYNSEEGYITPLLEYTFVHDGFVPVLTTGNTNENGEWNGALACAEYVAGRGSYFVCQVKLAGNTVKNPIAARFAQNLLAE